MDKLERFNSSDKVKADISRNMDISDSFYPSKNYAIATIVRTDGTTEEVGLASKYNMRTSAGANFWYTQISGSASSSTPAQYLALSANTLTVALADTTLSGEISSNGCSRAAGTVGGYTAPTTTTGAGQNFSYTVSYSWTATGSQTVNSAGLLTAASSGTLVLEANFSSTITLNSGDSLTLTWTISS